MTGAEQKNEYLHALLVALNTIRNRMPTCHHWAFDTLVFIAPRWSEGKHQMPYAFPYKDRCPEHRNARGIVLYECKLAVARMWDLMNTDETVGLHQLVGQLERYAEHGWDDGKVVGNIVDGFGLELPEDPPCESCGAKEDVSFAPDPFQAELNGDDTEVWLCGNCRERLAADI